MDACTDPAVEQVILKKSAQIAGTELLLNFIGYIAHLAPSPILYLCPRETDAKLFSGKRLSPTIRASPVLQERFSPEKSRTTGNTILRKKFPGGDILLVGVNSPANLASHPICYVLSDEDDRQTESAGVEGDPWELAWKRTTTYRHLRKGVRVSTPTLTESSRILRAYDTGDRRQYHIPCPRCGTLHTLYWQNVLWSKLPDSAEPDLSSVRLRCPHCFGEYGNAEKNLALADPRAIWIPRNPVGAIRSYELNQLYSTFTPISEIVAEFYRAKGNPAKMQVWTNTCLGEGFDGIGERVDFSTLALRTESYAAPVPRAASILTAGIDTQPDRLELETVAWAQGEESWSVDYRVFEGDPDIPEGQPGSPWDALTRHLASPLRHESGAPMYISVAMVDSGGRNTQAVYTYAARHRYSRHYPARLFPIKGTAAPDAPILAPVRHSRLGNEKRHRVRLAIINVDKAKLVIMGRLKLDDSGPGYCHFPNGRSDEYFRQLTSEKQVIRHERGKVKTAWVKTSERNEALDCRVYAYAAYLLANPNHEKLSLKIRQSAGVASDARATTSRKYGVELPQLDSTPSAQDGGGEILHDRITSTRHGRRTRTRDTRRRPAFRRDSW